MTPASDGDRVVKGTIILPGHYQMEGKSMAQEPWQVVKVHSIHLFIHKIYKGNTNKQNPGLSSTSFSTK